MPTDDPREPDDPTQLLPEQPDMDATHVMPPVPRASEDMPPSVPPPLAPAPAATPAAPPRSKAATVAIWLAIILMILLILSLLGAFLTSGGPFAPPATASPTASVTESSSPSPSPSITPSPTPSPTPTPTETTPPPPAGPVFTSFVVPPQAACPDETSTADVVVTWSSTGATKAWIGIATENAKDEPYAEVGTSGSETLPFPCSNESQVYTVTLEDASGNLAHESATVERSLS